MVGSQVRTRGLGVAANSVSNSTVHHSVVILDVANDVTDLEHILSANISLKLLSEHLSGAALTYTVNGGARIEQAPSSTYDPNRTSIAFGISISRWTGRHWIMRLRWYYAAGPMAGGCW